VDVRVYRIEHATSGDGPFNGGYAYDYTDAAREAGHPDCYEMPGPNMDKDRGSEAGTELRALFQAGLPYSDYCFGFTSPAQLVAWFTSAAGRRALSNNGFHVGIYDVSRDNIAMGNHQVAFIRPLAAIGSLDLVSLMPAGEC
jgi:hypothetical protein